MPSKFIALPVGRGDSFYLERDNFHILVDGGQNKTETAEAELKAAENISHLLQIPLVKLFEPTLEQLKINTLHLNEQIQALK